MSRISYLSHSLSLSYQLQNVCRGRFWPYSTAWPSCGNWDNDSGHSMIRRSTCWSPHHKSMHVRTLRRTWKVFAWPLRGSFLKPECHCGSAFPQSALWSHVDKESPICPTDINSLIERLWISKYLVLTQQQKRNSAELQFAFCHFLPLFIKVNMS